MSNSARVLFVLAVCFVLATSLPAAEAPENLALKAKTSATSENSDKYLSKFATDGMIPPAGSQWGDLTAAWAVPGKEAKDRADFTLQWDEPVEVAEIGTSWVMNDCWKDYEVYLDDAKEPAAKGTLKKIDGPQRIKLPATNMRTIIVDYLKEKQPQMKILLLAIFPREAPDSFRRQENDKVNLIIATYADGKQAVFLDLAEYFLDKDRGLSKAVMPDGLHASTKGFEIWAKAMEPVLRELLEEGKK